MYSKLYKGTPWGVHLLSRIFGFEYMGKRKILFTISVVFLTYISYAILHASRKPLAVSKSRLNGLCGNDTNCYGWAPFDTNKSGTYFAILDGVWTFAYGFGMFFTGHAADHSSKKIFYSVCIYGTGLCLCLFGFANYLNIHHIAFFIILQLMNGLFQSAGFPCTISIMANWIPKEKRGRVFGIWVTHALVGNVIGQTVTSILISKSWGLAFVVIGCACVGISLIVFLFLPTHPKHVGFLSEIEDEETILDNSSQELTIDITENDDGNEKPISFIKALLIPGVLEYSMSHFFTKFVVYTFMFWLPYYISVVGISGHKITASMAGLLATLFDIGGIPGSVLAGIIVDLTGKGGMICVGSLILSSGFIFLYSKFGGVSLIYSIVFLLLSGGFGNIPTSIIGGQISANLGKHETLKKNAKAGATVAAIIDGFGCLGAAVAPFIISAVSAKGWNYAMYLLMSSSCVSAIFLLRIVVDEIKEIKAKLQKRNLEIQID